MEWDIWQQDWLKNASAVFILSAVPERTSGRYGNRAARYVAMEVGHAAQNILLAAVALGLGGTPVGAFDDDEVSRLLQLPKNEQPLYLIPIGAPQ